MFDRDTLVAFCQTLSVLGLLGTARQLYLWRRSTRAMRWPTTPGVITSVRLKKGWYQPNVGRGDVRKRVYSVRLTYCYQVNGQRFTGTCAQMGTPVHETARSQALERLARYSVDQTVSVYYDAQRPADALLDPHLDPAWNRSVLLAVALLLFGACGWLGALVT